MRCIIRAIFGGRNRAGLGRNRAESSARPPNHRRGIPAPSRIPRRTRAGPRHAGCDVYPRGPDSTRRFSAWTTNVVAFRRMHEPDGGRRGPSMHRHLPGARWTPSNGPAPAVGYTVTSVLPAFVTCWTEFARNAKFTSAAGSNPATATSAVAQWACVLVAGSAIFGAPLGIRSAIDRLRASMTTDGVDERRRGCRWA